MTMRKNAIQHVREGLYDLYSKDDALYYTNLWKKFTEKTLSGVTTIRIEDVREVYRLDVDGRRFILKIDRYVPQRLEKKLRFIFFSPYFSRQMRAVHNALQRGCRVIPDIFFVAEKKEGLIITETCFIQEFIEGEHFKSVVEARDNAEAIIGAVKELHRCGLAHCDLNLDNIFTTPEGVKFIDLSCFGSVFGGKGKDIERLQERFGIVFPISSLAEKMAHTYTQVKFSLQNWLRSLGKKN